jgi:Ca-activated chloride channel homolog
LSNVWNALGLQHPGSPYLLLCLLAIPPALAGYLLLERRRRASAAAWSTPALIPNMVPRPSRQRTIPALLMLLGATLLLVGFARPRQRVNTFKPGATIVFAVDVSGSMAAKDVRPSRLAAADAVIAQFVKTLPASYRVALITFSSDFSVPVAPTFDRATFLAALPRSAGLQATAIGDAVAEAVKVGSRALGSAVGRTGRPPAAVILFTDGGQNSGRLTLAQAAALARHAGVTVSTFALGTPGGSVTQLVPVSGSSKKFSVVTQVPILPADLKALAGASGGAFFENAPAQALAPVLTQLAPRLVPEQKLREVTVRWSVAAIVAIMAGAVLSGLWFRRLV